MIEYDFFSFSDYTENKLATHSLNFRLLVSMELKFGLAVSFW
jgi:hypothetical protein